MSVEKWTKIAPIFFNKTAAEYSKIHVQFLYILSGRTIRKAEYDRIFKIISCARFRENCENRCLVVK